MNLNNFYLILGLLLVLFSCSDSKNNSISEKGDKSIIVEENNPSKVEKETIFSKINRGNLFKINKLKCYWKSDSVYKIIDKDTIPMYRLNRVLVNSNNEESILKLHSEDGSVYEHNGEGSFKDLNLDGYLDFTMYSEENSGSGGAYYNTYIFNGDKGVFEFSKLHSGGVLTVDSIKRTLKSTWRSGAAVDIYKILYFDNKGKIKHRERIITERWESFADKKYKLSTSYKKFVNNKLVSEKTDTSIYKEN